MDVKLWKVPYYQCDFLETLPLKPEESASKMPGGAAPASAGGACFNCGSSSHSLSSCPLPADREKIRKAMREWRASRADGEDIRYHADSTQSKTVPVAGVLSDRLKSALGIKGDEYPPYYRNFVYYGYPPSYYRVPKETTKIQWIEPTVSEDGTEHFQLVDMDDTENQSKQTKSSMQVDDNGIHLKRERTIHYPGLAAPLHDLSIMFDQYHPCERPSTPKAWSKSSKRTPYETTTPVSHTSELPQFSSNSSSKYTVTFSSIDDDLPTSSTTKKRPREEENSSEELLEPKRTKLAELIVVDESPEVESPSEDEDDVQPIVPLDQITSKLPQSSGIVTHNLTDRDLSTHGAFIEPTGNWEKLKLLLSKQSKHL